MDSPFPTLRFLSPGREDSFARYEKERRSMTGQAPACVKCGGEMRQGFVVEVARSRAYPNTWIEGAPEEHYLRGLKMKGRDTYPISTFRCPACGYLESYAHESAGGEAITTKALRPNRSG